MDDEMRELINDIIDATRDIESGIKGARSERDHAKATLIRRIEAIENELTLERKKKQALLAVLDESVPILTKIRTYISTIELAYMNMLAVFNRIKTWMESCDIDKMHPAEAALFMEFLKAFNGDEDAQK